MSIETTSHVNGPDSLRTSDEQASFEENVRLEAQDAFIDFLKSITPTPPTGVTWTQGCKIIDAVQEFLYPPEPIKAAVHYSGCPAIDGKPVFTCGGRSA